MLRKLCVSHIETTTTATNDRRRERNQIRIGFSFPFFFLFSCATHKMLKNTVDSADIVDRAENQNKALRLTIAWGNRVAIAAAEAKTTTTTTTTNSSSCNKDSK